MPASSATRRGNGPGHGPGWGGPAKGASASRLKPAGDEYSDQIRALARDPEHAAAKAPLRELAMKTWVAVAQNSENDSARVTAAEKLMDRLDGKATQKSLIGGAGGPPLAVEWRIVNNSDTDAPGV